MRNLGLHNVSIISFFNHNRFINECARKNRCRKNLRSYNKYVHMNNNMMQVMSYYFLATKTCALKIFYTYF